MSLEEASERDRGTKEEWGATGGGQAGRKKQEPWEGGGTGRGGGQRGQKMLLSVGEGEWRGLAGLLLSLCAKPRWKVCRAAKSSSFLLGFPPPSPLKVSALSLAPRCLPAPVRPSNAAARLSSSPAARVRVLPSGGVRGGARRSEGMSERPARLLLARCVGRKS